MSNIQIDFSSSSPDKDLEKDGIWREWSNGRDTIRLKLARAGGSNYTYRARVEELTRSYRRGSVDLIQLPPDVQDEVTSKAYSECIVKEWDSKSFGGLDRDNFSQAAVLYMFQKVPDTLFFCIQEANNASNYLHEVLKAESGN